jgi:hypothetical protein
MSDQEHTNPIGEKYSAVAKDFLEARVGEDLTHETIEQLSALLVSTTCELTGMRGAGQILGVTAQRVGQIQMPPVAARIDRRSLWLREQIEAFKKEREPRRQQAVGYLMRKAE